MKIAIVGKSGSGKSNMGDIVTNTIFRLDGDAKIQSDDPDRILKTFGAGGNLYDIRVRQLHDGELLESVLDKEILQGADVLVIINASKFSEWFRNVYSAALKS